MAERGKKSNHRQQKLNNSNKDPVGLTNTTFQRIGATTFDTSSISSSVVEEKLFGQNHEEAEDGPVLFICGKCKCPVGDSLSWDGSEDAQNQIRLKRVTENVLVGKDSRLYEAGKDARCLIMDLYCAACHSVLGMVYMSTPKRLDHKRFAFCFNVADIDSYVLGSASQMLAAEGPTEQLATLEYRGVVEHQLSEMKVLVMTMSQRLEEIEAGFQDGH